MIETIASISLLAWIGYLASIIIAFSMTMSSIVKFRIINLVGASLFSLYGFVIGAYPVGILNAFIVSVDIYYLLKIFGRKESFEVLEVRADNRYMLKFLAYHHKDIQLFFPGFNYKPNETNISFFVLRNMAVAGLFLGKKDAEGTLTVTLDYVIPAYRDFKNGKFVYYHLNNKFQDQGIKKMVTHFNSKPHLDYLLKNGFTKNANGELEKLVT